MRTQTHHFDKSSGNDGVTTAVAISNLKSEISNPGGAGEQLSLALSETERESLNLHEIEIREGLKEAKKGLMRAGKSLIEVHKGRLYRQEFATWEAYCLERAGISAHFAGKLMRAVENHGVVSVFLEQSGTDLIPGSGERIEVSETESVLRPLSQLPVEQRGPAYLEAAKSARKPGRPTGAEVKVAAEKASGKWPQLNSDGCYPEGNKAKYEVFNAHLGHAKIGVLRVGEKTWCGRCEHMFPDWGGGTSEGFYLKNLAAEEALAWSQAAERLIEDLKGYTQRVRGTQATEVAQDMIDWAHRWLPAVEPRRRGGAEDRAGLASKLSQADVKAILPKDFPSDKYLVKKKGMARNEPGPGLSELRKALIAAIHDKAIAAENAIYELSMVLVANVEFQGYCEAAQSNLRALKQKFVFDAEQAAEEKNKPAEPKAVDPLNVPCPMCHAKAGSRCKRPSGHSGPLVQTHAGRIKAAANGDPAENLFVLWRKPVKGMFPPNDRLHRFADHRRGWTSDPNKVKEPWSSREAASERLSNGDVVVTLARARELAAACEKKKGKK